MNINETLDDPNLTIAGVYREGDLGLHLVQRLAHLCISSPDGIWKLTPYTAVV